MSIEFGGSTEGIVKDIVDFFIVGRGIDCKSLLGGRSACCLEAASDPLLESTFWEAFPVCNLDSERSVGWCFCWTGVSLM